MVMDSKKHRGSISIGTLWLNAIEAKQHGPFITSYQGPCFLLPIKVFKNGIEIEVDALIDLGASASFIDINFVQRYGLLIKLRNMPVQVEVVDGRTIESGIITYKLESLKLTNKL